MELASAPNADETHSETMGETLDNLLRKILSSRLTNWLVSNRLSIFFILILVAVEIINFLIFYNYLTLKKTFNLDIFIKILYFRLFVLYKESQIHFNLFVLISTNNCTLWSISLIETSPQAWSYWNVLDQIDFF